MRERGCECEVSGRCWLCWSYYGSEKLCRGSHWSVKELYKLRVC